MVRRASTGIEVHIQCSQFNRMIPTVLIVCTLNIREGGGADGCLVNG